MAREEEAREVRIGKQLPWIVVLAGILLPAAHAQTGVDHPTLLSMEPLGSGSDFTVFEDHLGIASMDFPPGQTLEI